MTIGAGKSRVSGVSSPVSASIPPADAPTTTSHAGSGVCSSCSSSVTTPSRSPRPRCLPATASALARVRTPHRAGHSIPMDQSEPQATPLVVVGGSAGAIEPLRIVLGGLSAGFPAAVCVVVHLPEDVPSALPALLSRTGPLAASFAEDGDRLL